MKRNSDFCRPAVRSFFYPSAPDAEGKVIALNLRGAALEKQLSALFDEN
ncbi:MAG TPA: hypothetical protein PKC76_16455 [Saprospiraceae bacterium]|nr:hypothetical protein [Saprospiraceae bacterium]HMP25725.1 hypothetical protein [Saprospiraceae bacterium]